MTTETRALGDDHELVARARHGDQEAFSTLVERYRELACRAAFVVLGNAADAEDAAQDAFAKAYLALRQLSSETPFRPWLLRIVTNEARNLRTAARRRSRRTEVAGSDELRSSVAASAEIDALATERREELLKGLLLLREDDRLVITYRYLFDLPEAETSEALGWARGTVKSRLSRAIQRLREELRDRAPLLVVVPDLGAVLRGGGWQPGFDPVGWGSGEAFGQTVLARIAAGQAASAGFLAELKQHAGTALSATAVVSVAIAALVLAQVYRGTPRTAPPPTPAPAAQAPTASAVPRTVAIFGGDLDASGRAELSAVFGPGLAASESVSREELLTSREAAGLPVDDSFLALSSAALTCAQAGSGLQVRTTNITSIPAAAYAVVLLTTGVGDASLVVAAPSAQPITGETAVLGVLKAAAWCHGSPLDPARVQLAYELLDTTKRLADAGRDWNAAANLVLGSLEAIASRRASDEAAIGAAVDAAAGSAVVLTPEERASVVSSLMKLVGLDFASFPDGYRVEQPDRGQIKLVQR